MLSDSIDCPTNFRKWSNFWAENCPPAARPRGAVSRCCRGDAAHGGAGSVQRFCVGVSLACNVGVERSGGWLAAISLASRQRCSYIHHVNKGARGSSGAQQPPRDVLDTSHAWWRHNNTKTIILNINNIKTIIIMINETTTIISIITYTKTIMINNK